ncbi:MAG: large subunit ribosomal protein [Blastocatellia bacterium]|nr:large subunit ribosomal protein [Blastocatellia bacterium]
MRHLKAHRKLGRTSEHRMSMLRNLATSLVNARDERIVTTLPKAKDLRPFVEKAITLSRQAHNLEGDNAKAGAVHLRRQAAGFFHAGNMTQAALSGRRGQVRPPRTAGVAALKRLFDELGVRFADRPGGYTRILKLGRRDGDNAELAIIEFVDNPRELEAKENARKRAKSGTAGKKKSAKSETVTPAEDRKAGSKKAQKSAVVEEAPEASAETTGAEE